MRRLSGAIVIWWGERGGKGQGEGLDRGVYLYEMDVVSGAGGWCGERRRLKMLC